MSLLMKNEKITKTLGYLKSFKFDFQGVASPLEIDRDVFLLPFDGNREDIKHLKQDWADTGNLFKNIESYGTFVLHSLEKRRSLNNIYESLNKFYNLSLAVRLLTRRRCDNFMSLSYDDSASPTIFFDASRSGNDVYTDRDNLSYLGKGDLFRLKNILKAIEYNTIPDTIDPNKYSRLNNALRFYRIAYDTDWHLMKLILYFVVLESLFSDRDDHSDISYKVRIRSAYLLYPNTEDKVKREKVFEDLKHGYDIRSKFLHGDNVEKEILHKKKIHKIGDYMYTTDYLSILNEITSSIFLKIFENNENLKFFSTAQNSSSDKIFFNALVL